MSFWRHPSLIFAVIFIYTFLDIVLNSCAIQTDRVEYRSLIDLLDFIGLHLQVVSCSLSLVITTGFTNVFTSHHIIVSRMFLADPAWKQNQVPETVMSRVGIIDSMYEWEYSKEFWLFILESLPWQINGIIVKPTVGVAS